MTQYLLGYDLGSSSVKASLVDAATGQTVAAAQSPSEEMAMVALKPGWAEQDPALWWEHAQKATQACLKKSGVNGNDIAAIGISWPRVRGQGSKGIEAIHHLVRQPRRGNRQLRREATGREVLPGTPAEFARQLYRLQAQMGKR